MLNEDAPVDGEHIVVATFMKESAMEAIPTFKYPPDGFNLYCGNGEIRLFNRNYGNTFIYLRKPGNSNEDFITSIALQQISDDVKTVCPLLMMVPLLYRCGLGVFLCPANGPSEQETGCRYGDPCGLEPGPCCT